VVLASRQVVCGPGPAAKRWCSWTRPPSTSLRRTTVLPPNVAGALGDGSKLQGAVASRVVRGYTAAEDSFEVASAEDEQVVGAHRSYSPTQPWA
jgi:hypothetical protein